MTTASTVLKVTQPDAESDEVSTAEPLAAAGLGSGRRARSAIFADLSALDVSVLVLCLLLLVAFAPPLLFDGWTPRFALVTAFLPVGLIVFGSLVRHRDTAAWWLLGALTWMVVAGATSDAPRSALLGFVGGDLSAYTIVSAGAIWAAARQTSPSARERIVDVVIWASAAVALVGLLQVLFDVRSGPLALAFGRPKSFLSNPVYFGAVCAAATMVATAVVSARGRSARMGAAVVLGIGVSISGSRVALAAALVALVGFLALRRTRPAFEAAGMAAAGLVAGVAIDRWFGAGRNAATRFVDGSAGGGRITVWRYGLEAFTDRPVLGNGFGRFRPAVQGRFSIAFVRDNASDEVSQPWFDPHNVVIGVLVAVGVVGFVLFLGWVINAGRCATGPLVWGLVPLVAHWMLQPVSLFTLPLAAIMLGASAPSVDGAVTGPSDRRGRWLVTIAGCAGLAAGTSLIVGDAVIRRAADVGDGSRAASVARLTDGDPVVANIVSQIYAFDPSESDRLGKVLQWRRVSAETQPDRPFWWSQLAAAQMDVEDYDGARASLDRAFELQPNNPTTLRTSAILAVRTGDRSELQQLLAQSCELDMPECELDIDELLPEE